MRPRLVIALIAFSSLVGAPSALAAVPVGEDGSLRPTDGAELLEAVALAAAPTVGPGDLPTHIVLAEAQYEVDRAIVLDGTDGDTIEGVGAGSSRIVGTGGATTLLRISGEGTSVSGVSMEPSGAGPARFPVATVSDGAQLSDFYLFVPDTLPGVTGVEASGVNPIIASPEVESYASSPAIHSTGSLDLRGGSVYGGNPTLDVDAAGRTTQSQSLVDHTAVSGGEATSSIVRAQAGSAAARVTLNNVIIRGGAEDATLVDVRGASDPAGSFDLDLTSSTLSGAPGSTGVRVASGAATSPTTARLVGLLALGSDTTVDCATTGTPSAVTIEGVYRSGALPSGSACSVSESGRRSGGDPSLTTAFGLSWGSPAIDAIARPTGASFDARRGDRTSTGPNTPLATPTDLGAIEYQYLAPWLDEVTADIEGDEDLVRFSVAAGDENEGESDLLTVVWRFPDGSTATGSSVTRRFTSADVGDISVSATDPSGLTTTLTVATALDLGLVGPDEGADEVDPTPTPTPTPTQQTLPETVVLPRPTAGLQSPFAAAAIGPIKSIKRTQQRANRTVVRPSGLGIARSGEASIDLQLDRAANVTVLVRRWEGTRLLAVPNARFSKDTGAGTTTIHLSARVGTATLRIGLYRVTILVRPSSGPAERRDLNVRVVR